MRTLFTQWNRFVLKLKQKFRIITGDSTSGKTKAILYLTKPPNDED